ncbi:Ribosomal protein S18 acetylase RimI [Tranquillimonas rosea]|uniref:Ribosomal protein S18 acetylase RimI n=1 Tax=Tranquillimonas rosea TaxID=641238 RepID=A0A1H9TC82_9RHOB|nr:GNAT family N-acetyltransferase [Tranquillimonas rosea]SER94716.1 Ribosomal protein S18 acetylase RimI [Tranquillimonas rosea]
MTVTLRIATQDDFERIDRMSAAYRDETGLSQDAESRREALATLLEGTPHGVAYLIGPPSSPVGYLMISFGFSLAEGGLAGTVDEIYVRPAVRRRRMGSEALAALAKSLAKHDVCALHLQVPADAGRLIDLFTRQGFNPRNGTKTMSRRL